MSNTDYLTYAISSYSLNTLISTGYPEYLVKIENDIINKDI